MQIKVRAAAGEKNAEAWGSNRTMIFIVDDDGAVRDSLLLLLECEGFAARAFGSAEEFLDLARPVATDCLILDVQMPGMNGLDLLAAISRADDAPAVIVLTGMLDGATEKRALAAGARAVVEKPCPAALMIELVHAALGE
jgi:two-component system response regulator FixJ